MMQRLIQILWPSFLVAGLADLVFISLLDPQALMYRGLPPVEQPIAVYSVGFFVFWLLGIASSALTCYFQRGADEINRCPLLPKQRPEGCPKREDESACC
jgi:hypothetical protein